MVRAHRYAFIACALVALGLLAPASVLAARATTAPGKQVNVYFVINDQKIAYEILRKTAGGGNDLVTLEKYVVRGDVATFYVINRGRKSHGFEFYGHKFPPLKPGTRTHFSATLLRRGTFPFASTTDKGKAFRGVFPVY